jgi:hypothetical protein
MLPLFGWFLPMIGSSALSQVKSASDLVPWPTRIRELGSAERFVVRSFRRWILGLRLNNGFHWSFVWTDISTRFGESEGGVALAGFARLILALQGNARRNIKYHHPCCPCLCADEVSIANLVAACQQGRLSHAHALAEWLVYVDAVGDLLETASQLAHLMRQNGLIFADRTEQACHFPAGSISPGNVRTVH